MFQSNLWISSHTGFCLILLQLFLCKVNKNRSSRLEVFCKKGALGNFAKFTGINLCQSLFFNKVAGPPVLDSLFLIKLQA